MANHQQENNPQVKQEAQGPSSDEQTKLIETLRQQKEIIALQADLAEAEKRFKDLQNPAPKSALDKLKEQIELAKEEQKLTDLKNPAPKSELEKLRELKELLGTSTAGSIPGDVKIEEGAGSMEIELLSSTTVAKIAQRVAQRVNSFSAGKKITIYLYTGQEGQKSLSLQALTAYRGQVQLVRIGYENALANSNETLKEIPSFSESPAGGKAVQQFSIPVPAVVAASTLALDSATKLLSFFRSDYTVRGSTLSTPDSILATEVANFLTIDGHSVLMPQVYNQPSLAVGIQGVIEDCQFLDRKRDEAIRNIAKHKEQVDAGGTDGALIGRHQAAADSLRSAMGLHESLEKKLFTIDGQGDINLEKVAMGIAMERAFSSTSGGAHILLLKDTKAGGTSYTVKNLWTGIGMSIPFHLGAGIVTSFLLFNGNSAQIEASGVETSHSGYASVSELGKPVHWWSRFCRRFWQTDSW
jgi:hypothetical protein